MKGNRYMRASQLFFRFGTGTEKIEKIPFAIQTQKGPKSLSALFFIDSYLVGSSRKKDFLHLFSPAGGGAFSHFLNPLGNLHISSYFRKRRPLLER